MTIEGPVQYSWEWRETIYEIEAFKSLQLSYTIQVTAFGASCINYEIQYDIGGFSQRLRYRHAIGPGWMLHRPHCFPDCTATFRYTWEMYGCLVFGAKAYLTRDRASSIVQWKFQLASKLTVSETLRREAHGNLLLIEDLSHAGLTHTQVSNDCGSTSPLIEPRYAYWLQPYGVNTLQWL